MNAGVTATTTSTSVHAARVSGTPPVLGIEWDAENRLTRVCTGACGAGTDPANMLARFAYDGSGRRAQKVAGSITRSYVYDGDHVAERLSGGATGTIRYFHEPGIDDWLGRQETSGSATFFVADHLGSIVRHTNSAGTVTLTLTRTYDAWGNLDATGAAVSGPAFTGRDWDAEIGLYYYRARYYDPKIGRFISEDPIGWIGGVNLYAYVTNNPTNRVDPTGLRGCKDGDPYWNWRDCVSRCFNKLAPVCGSTSTAPLFGAAAATAVLLPKLPEGLFLARASVAAMGAIASYQVGYMGGTVAHCSVLCHLDTCNY